jgi:hypothetical protein
MEVKTALCNSRVDRWLQHWRNHHTKASKYSKASCVLSHLLVLDNNPAGPIGPLSGPHLWTNHQRRRLRYTGTLAGCVADQTGCASSTFQGVLGSSPDWPQIQHWDKGGVFRVVDDDSPSRCNDGCGLLTFIIHLPVHLLYMYFCAGSKRIVDRPTRKRSDRKRDARNNLP